MKYLKIQGRGPGTFLTDEGIVQLAQLQQLQHLELQMLDITDRSLEAIGQQQNLESLELLNTQCTTDGLRHISNLTLKELHLRSKGFQGEVLKTLPKSLSTLTLTLGPNVTDYEAIGQFTKLRNLSVGTGFSNEHFDALAQLPNLHYLSLYSSTITDEGIAKLRSVVSLRSISISSVCNVSEACVGSLAALPNLEDVGLDGQRFASKSIASLVRATGLKRIMLDDVRIKDDDLTHLAELPQLENLRISNCDGITNKSLKHLSEFTQLKYLSLYGMDLSKKIVGRLQKELPNCSVDFTAPIK